MLIPLPLAKTLELALNQYLSLDAESQSALSALDGQVIEVHFTGALDGHLYFFTYADRIEVARYFDGDVDTCIRGAPIDLLSLRGSKSAALDGRVQIEGDMAVGRRFQRLLSDVEVDWEEEMSRYFGDIAAHQMGRAFRGVEAWWQQRQAHFHQDMSEYLQEEIRYLPTQYEWRLFADDVEHIRDDAARLDARLQALEAAKA